MEHLSSRERELSTRKNIKEIALLILITTLIAGCSGGGESAQTSESTDASADQSAEDEIVVEPSELDLALQPLIAGLETDPTLGRDLPDVEDALPQLGKQLFFSKSLGGNFDAACVSCHHPALGGADGLSLSVGVDAIDPDLLGPGRVHVDGVPLVPRNAPTVFNTGLWDSGLFWDSRVESIGKEVGTNGSISGISTPDSGFLIEDAQAGPNLAAAQVRFPVTSEVEMKTTSFEDGSDGDSIRDHLAARIGDYGVGENELAQNEWLLEFRQAFGVTSDAESLITFDNIAIAIGEYERSMVFVDTPWQRYVQGDLTAITDTQKQGALLFFGAPNQGGAGCSNCHSGALFSDGRHHTIAFPQIGPGTGFGTEDDFGREQVTENAADRYRYRTPSLLNITATAPYGHAGVFETLHDVVNHYNNPAGSVENFFNEGGWCQLTQFEDIPLCEDLYPNAESNSLLALGKLRDDIQGGNSRLPNINLTSAQIDQIVAFLGALTDPCVSDRECLAPWIAEEDSDDPDEQLLLARDQFGALF